LPERDGPGTATSVADPRIAVVLITRNGRDRIGRALRNLCALPEAPQVVVVDNGSTDGTATHLAGAFPRVTVLRLPENRGAAGRNAGVAAVDAPYVAFAEDDSWYEPGALARAADVLDAHPRVALVNAHVLVGDERRTEPLHADMVDTPVPDEPGLPGHRILSFLEGVSVVRRDAFLAAGGFDPRLLIGGPEEHLAAELLRCGWELRYVPDVVARHCPDHRQPSAVVRRLGLRNTLWFSWLRRPLRPALRHTAHVIGASPRNATTLRGVLDAVRGLPWVLRERRVLPPAVEVQMALLDAPRRRARARRGGRGAWQP
jgi:GT2 family glycosyltransferase